MTDPIMPTASKNTADTQSADNAAAIIAQMRTLIDTLKTHNFAYYVLDNPIL